MLFEHADVSQFFELFRFVIASSFNCFWFAGCVSPDLETLLIPFVSVRDLRRCVFVEAKCKIWLAFPVLGF
jgi:hypothetical protein